MAGSVAIHGTCERTRPRAPIGLMAYLVMLHAHAPRCQAAKRQKRLFTVTDVKDVTTVTTVTFETVTTGVTGVYETVTLVVTTGDPDRLSKNRGRSATRR